MGDPNLLSDVRISTTQTAVADQKAKKALVLDTAAQLTLPTAIS